jgi:hypothetical protein
MFDLLSMRDHPGFYPELFRRDRAGDHDSSGIDCQTGLQQYRLFH